jgi:hypothetical protein
LLHDPPGEHRSKTSPARTSIPIRSIFISLPIVERFGDWLTCRLPAEDEAGERAYGEGDEGSDEDVPGEGHFRNGEAGVEDDCLGLKPEGEVEGEAADHAEDRTRLGREAGDGSEEKNTEEATVGDGGNGETGLDDVALAAGVDAVKGDGEENDDPPDGAGTGDEHAFAVVGMGAEVHVEVYDGSAGEGIKGGGEVGHGGCEHRGNEESSDADRHLLDDKGGKDAIRAAEGLRAEAIEDKEAGSDEKEEGELEKDDDSGGEQGEAGLTQVASGEQALHHELVCSVGGHGEEGAAEESGPEGVGLGEVECEVKEVKPTRDGSDLVDPIPASRDMRAQGGNGDEGSSDVYRHLYDVGPDNGGQASFEGVDESEERDDGDREGGVGADGDAYNDGDGEDADAFRGRSGEKEETRGDLVERKPEAPVDKLVGRKHRALEVFGQEDKRDDDASDHVTEDDLKEAEVAGESYAGNGDDGEDRGFGGDNGEGYGPPGNGIVGEEVILEGLFRFAVGAGGYGFAEAKPEEGDAEQIGNDECEIEGVEARRPRRHDQYGDRAGKFGGQIGQITSLLNAGYAYELVGNR